MKGNPVHRKYRNRAWLHHQYCTLGLTTTDIGRDCGVSEATILYWMNKFEIPTRPRSAPRKQRRAAQRKPLWREEKILRELYHECKMSVREIAVSLHCTSPTILRWMDVHGIKARTREEALRIARTRIYKDWDKHGDGGFLRYLYVDGGFSYRDIAIITGASQEAVRLWMKKQRIKPRPVGETGRFMVIFECEAEGLTDEQLVELAARRIRIRRAVRSEKGIPDLASSEHEDFY